MDGVGGILVYFSLYIAMTAGAFACVLMMSRGGQAVESIGDLAGLSRTRPYVAFSFGVLMFSMAGIPPFSGFFSKLYVFLPAIHASLYGLAVVGVVSSVIACYYYLKIVKLMYFDEAVLPFDMDVAGPVRLVLIFSIAITLLFIVIPAPLVSAAHIAAAALFP